MGSSRREAAGETLSIDQLLQNLCGLHCGGSGWTLL